MSFYILFWWFICLCICSQKSAPRPMQPHQSFSSPGRYLGSGAPSPVLMGGSPYGSSLFNGSSMSPYDVPFSGGSPYHFNYNSRFPPAGPHYRPFHMSGPPSPYHGRSMMGSGMYGMALAPMDRYGFGMAMSPAAAAAMVCIKDLDAWFWWHAHFF